MTEVTRTGIQPVLAGRAAGHSHRSAPSLTSEITLAAVTTAASYARLYTASTLNAWGLGLLCHNAELVTSELVTNAIQATAVTQPEPHWSDLARLALIRLRLTVLGDGLIIEVWDRNSAPPLPCETARPGGDFLV
jgi:hypothetical protein